MSISVSIVEDNAQVRGSLAKLIDGAPGFRCVSRHGSAEEALKELPKILPEVVLMDINLPGMNGVECVRRLKPQLPGTQLIMLTVYQNTEHIFNALAAGATGYMLKQTPPPELLSAIKEVHAGGSPMSGHIARKIVATLCSTGTPAVFLHPAEAVHGDLGIYTPGDPTVLLSKNGSSRELLALVPVLRELLVSGVVYVLSLEEKER